MSLFASAVAHFGFWLDARARFRLSGVDCLRYLNGQVTQDLSRVTKDLALPACITSAKGRLQAEVWVSIDPGTSEAPVILVDAPGELREALLPRLERYIVADDVIVEDVTGVSALFHFPGPQAPNLSAEFMASCVRAARLGEPGWDVWVPSDRIDLFRQTLGDGLGRSSDYERVRIERGIPAWGAELTEETLPPEAGLDKTHIDYHKGCYIGQEVISRLKSVGRVNQTLQRFRGKSRIGLPETVRAPFQFPTPGELLYTTADRKTSVGWLTSVSAGSNEEVIALGYLKRGVAEGELQTEKGFALALVP